MPPYPPCQKKKTTALFFKRQLPLVVWFSLCFHLSSALALEIQTNYATVYYDSEKQLQRLNDELFLAKDLAIELRARRTVTIEDEIAAKFDVIIEKVQEIIDMRPENLRFEVRLFSSAKEAQAALYQKYKRQVNYISFYSRQDNLVYLSVEEGRLGVVAHEFGHVVVEHYFERSPPVKMHEVMAQYAEKHIVD